MFMLNPEPLLFMTFPKEENWPFPAYHGSCGRLSVFDYAGQKPISEAYFMPWEERVKIARQLLKMAEKFTFNEDEMISIYLTDWSADNFILDEFGVVTAVDGEGVVLVDRKLVQERKSPGWDVKHTASICGGNKFCFHPEDLCTHSHSDLNFVGVCAGFLANSPFNKQMPRGLLYGIPAEVNRKHPLLGRLLEECARPTHPGGRFEAAKEISEILQNV